MTSYRHYWDLSPSDTVNEKWATDAIWVGAAGNVVAAREAVPADVGYPGEVTEAFEGLTPGAHDIVARRVNLTLTTAGALVGLRRSAVQLPAFEPSQLFGPGDVGAVYDPSDLATMFQESTGQTPAEVDAPVGLMLDKSQGLVLGPELVTNGGFDTDSDWSTGPWTIGSGVASSDGSVGNLSQSGLAITPGGTYEVKVTTSGTYNGVLNLRFTDSTSNVVQINSDGVHTYILKDAGVDNVILFRVGGANDFIGNIDNVSVKLIAGNHASQATSARRPILRSDGTLFWLASDGVDDWMRATFTIAQPWDRIAGMRQDTWINSGRVFSGGTALSGELTQSPFTPDLRLSSGAFLAGNSDGPVGADIVTTERHDGLNSRMAIDNGVYTTGNGGTTLPGGITIFADNAGNNNTAIRCYGLTMIHRPTTGPLTDAEIANTRAYYAQKGA